MMIDTYEFVEIVRQAHDRREEDPEHERAEARDGEDVAVLVDDVVDDGEERLPPGGPDGRLAVPGVGRCVAPAGVADLVLHAQEVRFLLLGRRRGECVCAS